MKDDLIKMFTWKDTILMATPQLLPLSYVPLGKSHFLRIDTLMFDTYHMMKRIALI